MCALDILNHRERTRLSHNHRMMFPRGGGVSTVGGKAKEGNI